MALRVEAGTQDGQIGVRRLTAAELAHQEHEPASAAKGRVNKIAVPAAAMRSTIRSWINSPLTAAWLLAIAVLSLFAILTLTPRFRLAAPRPSSATIERETPVGSTPIAESVTPKHNDSGSTTEQVTIPSPAAIDQTSAISALEPANVDGGLPWPPVAMSIETVKPVVSEVKAIDVKGKMNFRFPLYKQATPISRRDLIAALDEQLDARIRYSAEELGNANLDKTITFELVNPTIGDIIRLVADGAGWEVVIEATGLRLKRKESPDASRRNDLDK